MLLCIIMFIIIPLIKSFVNEYIFLEAIFYAITLTSFAKGFTLLYNYKAKEKELEIHIQKKELFKKQWNNTSFNIQAEEMNWIGGFGYYFLEFLDDGIYVNFLDKMSPTKADDHSDNFLLIKTFQKSKINCYKAMNSIKNTDPSKYHTLNKKNYFIPKEDVLSINFKKGFLILTMTTRSGRLGSRNIRKYRIDCLDHTKHNNEEIIKAYFGTNPI